MKRRCEGSSCSNSGSVLENKALPKSEIRLVVRRDDTGLVLEHAQKNYARVGQVSSIDGILRQAITAPAYGRQASKRRNRQGASAYLM